jgi:hypothetical protein
MQLTDIGGHLHLQGVCSKSCSERCVSDTFKASIRLTLNVTRRTPGCSMDASTTSAAQKDGSGAE